MVMPYDPPVELQSSAALPAPTVDARVPRPVPTASRSEPRLVTDTYETLRLRTLDEMQARGIRGTESPEAVRALIHDVVSSYQAAARNRVGGDLLADPAAIEARLERSLLEYGPLTPLVTDIDGRPLATEIFIKGAEISYFDESGRLRQVDEPCSEAELRHQVAKMLAEEGRAIDETNPLVVSRVLNGRGRITASIPPVAERLDCVLRRYSTSSADMYQLLAWDALSWDAANFMTLLAQSGQASIVFSGQPDSGKTTAMNAILKMVPTTTVIRASEDVREVRIDHLVGGQWLTVSGGVHGEAGIDLSRLVSTSLQSGSSLLVVGETRGAEAYWLTRATNAGCQAMTTVHSNSASMALEALVDTAIMAAPNVNEPTVRRLFARTIDVVMHCAKQHLHQVADGHRPLKQVMEIAAVPPGQHADGFGLEPIFKRARFGAPLIYTGVALPDDLRERLEWTLPDGVSVLDVVNGDYSLLSRRGGA